MNWNKSKLALPLIGMFLLSGCSVIRKIKDRKSRLTKIEESLENAQANIDGLAKDTDGDGVSDLFDKEPNTPADLPVDGSGRAFDHDGDGVPDYLDSEPYSEKGARVDESGIELDSDNDGIPDSRDIEPDTYEGAMVDHMGRTIMVEEAGALPAPIDNEPGILPYAYLKDFELYLPTDRHNLRNVISDDTKTIGDVSDKLESALKKAGHSQFRYMEVQEVGLALMTWGYCYSPVTGFRKTVDGYCKRHAPTFEGWLAPIDEYNYKKNPYVRIRYFVFIIGLDWDGYDFDPDNTPVYAKMQEAWESAGRLKESVKRLELPVYTQSFVEALVYEFEVDNQEGERLYLTGNLEKCFTAKQHLEFTGLLQNLN